MIDPTYSDTVTVGGVQSSYQFGAFPNPTQSIGGRSGLLSQQSLILVLTLQTAAAAQYDISGATATLYVTANSDPDYTPVSLGAGALSDSGAGGGGTTDTVTFTVAKNQIPDDLGAYGKTNQGNAKFYVILEDADTYLEFYEGVNVYDTQFGGTGGSAPNANVVRKNNLGVVLDTLNTPPGSPSTNDAYLVGTSPTGAWLSPVDLSDNLVIYNGAAWVATAPTEGDFLFDKDEDVQKRYTTAWVAEDGSPFDDANPLVKDTADATKLLRIDVGAITTATTRVLTMPDNDVNLGTDFQEDLSGAVLTAATVATGDKITGQDIDDSDNLKTFTAQSIADLKVTELSEDTTPQAGGDISMNSHMMQWSKGADVASGNGSNPSIVPATFDGANDYVSVTDSDDFNFGAGDFTWSGWFNIDANKNYNVLMGQYQDSTNRAILYVNSSQQIGFYFETGGSALADYISTGVTFTPGTWYHIAVVRNGTTLTIYQNASSVSLTVNTAISTNSYPNYSATFDTGRGYIGGGLSYFDGYAYQWSLHTNALDSTAITAMYFSGIPRDRSVYTNSDITSNNILWIYGGDDKPTNTEEFDDQSGNGNDGTNNGTVFSGGSITIDEGLLTLGTDGNEFDITGTETVGKISAIAVGTVVALQFDGALTFTHHATDLILPGAANITTAAGDVAIMQEYATGDWRCLAYTKADGTPVVGGGGGGIIAQVVYTEDAAHQSSTSTFPRDDTVPQNTEGAAYAALDTSITPTNASSKLYIDVFLPVNNSYENCMILALFKDSDADAIAVSTTGSSGSLNQNDHGDLRVEVSAGSTSSRTYKLRYGGTGGSAFYINGTSTRLFGGAAKSYMRITEVLP